MHFTALFFSVLPILAAASVIPEINSRQDATTTAPAPISVNQCNTGDLQCCQSAQTAGSTSVQSLAGLLGIALPDLSALVGLTCSGITAVGVGGTSCTAQPVCCSNNNFNGLIALGCTPVNLNL